MVTSHRSRLPGDHGRRIFVTFADAKYEPSLRRIARQARAMDVYDEILIRRKRDLDPRFVRRHRDILRPNVRGYGYWIWKPQVVHAALEQCRDGDIVHYCDAGCHLLAAGRPRLLEYFALAESAESGVLAFKFEPPRPPFRHDGRPLPGFRNIEWCKADLLGTCGLLDDRAFLEDFTLAATTFFVRRSRATLDFVREWRDFMDRNVPLIDDSPSHRPNLPEFREHRHDQAVFNCLAHGRGFETASAYEFDYPSLPGEPRPCDITAGYPICAVRDKKIRFATRVWRKLGRWWSALSGSLRR
ncbi:MAG: hypothetical protein EBZ59_01025 [Planctomycetia bacterium]|nr:hypothetical protein [Planctomycetia bacterium]